MMMYRLIDVGYQDHHRIKAPAGFVVERPRLDFLVCFWDQERLKRGAEDVSMILILELKSVVSFG